MLHRNSTSYQSTVTSKIMNLFKTYKEKEGEKLMFHQYLIRDMMTNPIYGIGQPGNNRGLLIYHTVGTGKTVVAASVLLALIDLKQPVLLLPKSLQSNFLGSIDMLVQDPKLAETVKNKINFVSLDAYNSASQMKMKAVTLNNKLLIIDEAHNFFKSIINSANETTNARTLYNMIMDAVDMRIIFLSGTPITKDPFELVPCVNMLCGSEVLPVSYEGFYHDYVEDRVNVKNKNKLQNRLFGLISYVAFDKPLDPNGVPKTNEEIGRPDDLGITVENVEMSYDQYLRYITVRDREDKLASTRKAKKGDSGRMRDVPALSIPSSTSKGSSYYVESRQQSDFSVPTEYKNILPSKLKVDLFDKVSSPKITQLLTHIKKGQLPILVYSQFIKSGLAVVGRYLQNAGYSQWTVQNDGNNSITHAKRYCIISGDIKPEDRAKTVAMFNSAANMYGDIIAAILVSETGAEGLDLKHIREVHILEPYWDFSRILQVQGRAIRKNSHNDLPESDRNVKTYIYVSTPNKKARDVSKFRENETIDQRFLRNAMRKYKLIEKFLMVMKEVSIECVSNQYNKFDVNCRICTPDDAQLFHPKDVSGDISKPDPCREFSKETIKTKLITIEGKKFNYREDNTSPLGYIIYQYNDELNGYMEVPLNSKEAMQIVEAIEKKA
jgi:superfamily II DNA or RNA helicase